MHGIVKRSYIREGIEYFGRFRQFAKADWVVFTAWIGMMVGLFAVVAGFLAIGVWRGVEYPAYVWNVPIGIFIFVAAIAVDTIGHRTVYKGVLQATGEDLVHHITIFSGVTSVVVLCMAYTHPDALRIPAYVLSFLAVFYSIVDETMHWMRYMKGGSDRIEMWSHFFIFVGHILMTAAWLYWFEMGYPGVAETFAMLNA